MLLRQRSALSVVWLCCVVFTTVFWANVVFAQYPTDTGARDPDEWYFCHASRFNESGSTHTGPYSDMTCDHLLWQESTGGGGVYESLLMTAETLADCSSPGCAAQVRGYVIPPRGMKQFTYHCDAVSQHEATGGTFSTSSSAGTGLGAFFSTDSTGWTVDAANPVLPGTPVTTDILDVVGTYRATSYDRFWNADIADDWANAAIADGVWFHAQAATINGNATGYAKFECAVTDWESWPEYLGGNPEWSPGPGDFVPDPTPTPFPGFPGFGTVTPLAPISNTVDIVIGSPGTPECFTIVPSNGISETVFGYDVEAGWSDYEVCSQPTEFQMEFFGVDWTGFILLAVAVSSIGIVYKLFRTG